MDVAGVLTYIPDEGRHEFDGEFVVALTAQSRETESYLAMLVLGSALSVLYNGRLVDEVGFFPQQSASEVLQRCLGQSDSTALDLWQSLQGASP